MAANYEEVIGFFYSNLVLGIQLKGQNFVLCGLVIFYLRFSLQKQIWIWVVYQKSSKPVLNPGFRLLNKFLKLVIGMCFELTEVIFIFEVLELNVGIKAVW